MEIDLESSLSGPYLQELEKIASILSARINAKLDSDTPPLLEHILQANMYDTIATKISNSQQLDWETLSEIWDNQRESKLSVTPTLPPVTVPLVEALSASNPILVTASNNYELAKLGVSITMQDYFSILNAIENKTLAEFMPKHIHAKDCLIMNELNIHLNDFMGLFDSQGVHSLEIAKQINDQISYEPRVCAYRILRARCDKQDVEPNGFIYQYYQRAEAYWKFHLSYTLQKATGIETKDDLEEASLAEIRGEAINRGLKGLLQTNKR